ncbi:ATP-binding protein [Tolypothrix campylonemoides VB511288]|nr:ATP-binding protein [Tolypothrix campylonemoides VB511288]
MADILTNLKNRFFITSLGVGLASTVGLITSFVSPQHDYKFLSTFGIGTAVSGLLVTELLTSAVNSELEKSEKRQDTELVDKKAQIRELQSTINKTVATISSLESEKETLKIRAQALEKTLLERDIELVTAKQSIENLNQKLQKVGRFSTSEANRIVRDTYHNSVKKLEGLLNALIRNYPDVADFLQNILSEVSDFKTKYIKRLEEYESLESFDELLDIGLDLQEKIIDRTTELKVKAQTLVIRYLDDIASNSVPLEDYQKYLSDLAAKAELEIVANRQAIAQEWVASNEETVTRYETEFAEAMGLTKYSVSRMEELNAKIEYLENELGELKKPLAFTGVIDYAVAGNAIINYYYKNFGYKLDALRWEETETGYTLHFYQGRNDRQITPDMLHDKDNREQIAGLTNSLTIPSFEPNYQNGCLALNITLRKVRKTQTDLKIKDILTVGDKRSWLITGHPGAGKTSVMIYLGQQLGGKEARRYALNPHKDEYSAYEPYGFIEINDLSAILEHIDLFYKELELRRQDASRRWKLVICIDELGAILERSLDPKALMGVIKQIAVEGRKLGMIVLVGNHSQTTAAIEMDAEFRGAFYQLFLVGAARYAIEQPHRKTRLTPVQEKWINETAYPALLLSNSSYSLVKHPTHGDYEEYQDSGNPPQNLEDWEVNLEEVELIKCPHCKTEALDHSKNGKTPSGKQKFKCKKCEKHFSF